MHWYDLIAGGSAEKHAIEETCSATCKTLSNKDYTDLLWTTLSEFPGLLIRRSGPELYLFIY